MIIPKTILEKCQSFIDSEGITILAKGAKIDYRTLRNSMQSGQCTKPAFKRLTAFLKKEDEFIAKIENDFKS